MYGSLCTWCAGRRAHTGPHTALGPLRLHLAFPLCGLFAGDMGSVELGRRTLGHSSGGCASVSRVGAAPQENRG